MSEGATAFVFPGQGSQYVGMSSGLVSQHPAGRAVLEQASDTLGGGFADLMRQGPLELLTLTETAQPAILAVSVAWLKVLAAERPELTPVIGAGHSLGEYSALVAAGAIDFTQALHLVRLRGRAMQAAVPVGEGTMAAIRGLDPAGCEAVCAEVSARMGRVIEVAALNSPGQVVIAGHVDAVDAAIEAASAAGARAARKLTVSAPFHCSLLTGAGDRLAEALAEVSISAPMWPVLQNVDAAASADPDIIRANLVAQVSRTVRWEDCARAMIAAGATRFIEVGPGRTLAGLCKKIDRGIQTISLDRAGALEKV